MRGARGLYIDESIYLQYAKSTWCPNQAKGSCKLRGKANEVKWFTHVMAKLWEKYYNSALSVHRLVLTCLQAGAAMEKSLDANKHYYALPGNHFWLLIYLSTYEFHDLYRHLKSSIYNYACHLAYAWASLNKNNFTDDVAKKLVASAFIHYNSFWQLKEHYDSENTSYFRLTSKAHHCLHACISSKSLSPRRVFFKGRAIM